MQTFVIGRVSSYPSHFDIVSVFLWKCLYNSLWMQNTFTNTENFWYMYLILLSIIISLTSQQNYLLSTPTLSGLVKKWWYHTFTYDDFIKWSISYLLISNSTMGYFRYSALCKLITQDKLLDHICLLNWTGEYREVAMV